MATPIGYVPTPELIDLTGLDGVTVGVADSLAVNVEDWRVELSLIEEWFAQIGDSLPNSMRDELEALRQRLG